MNDFLVIGKIANTHGIKGEIKILSDFERKNIVFQKGFPIYIGKEHQKETIQSYRPHQIFDMVILEGYQNINEVLKYKGKTVFVKRADLNLSSNDYLVEELIQFTMKDDHNNLGKVTEIVYNKAGILLKVQNLDQKNFYIPYNEHFVKQVDLQNQTIIVQNVQGLII